MSFVALLGTLCYGLSLALLTVLYCSRAYPLVSHAVSDYALGKTARLFSLYGFSGTLGALCMAWLTYHSVHPSFSCHIPVLLLLLIASRVGAQVFPTVLEGQPMTRTGRLHYLFAILNFTFAYMVVAGATPALGSVALTAEWAATLLILKKVAATSLTGVVITLLPRLRHVFGLFERIFLLSVVLWFFGAALALWLLGR